MGAHTHARTHTCPPSLTSDTRTCCDESPRTSPTGLRGTFPALAVTHGSAMVLIGRQGLDLESGDDAWVDLSPSSQLLSSAAAALVEIGLLQTAVVCLLTLFTWTVRAPWQRLSVNSVCLCVCVCTCVLFQIHSSSLTLDVSINHFWSLIYVFNWAVLVLKLLMSRLMSVCFCWGCFCFENWVQGSFRLSPFWCLKNLFVQLLVTHVHFTTLA